MEPSKFSCTGRALSITCESSTCGCAACISATAARAPCATSNSPAPLVRKTSKPTTVLPFIVASERGSLTVSLTLATWPKRTLRPSAKGISRSARSSAVCTVAMVRTDCSAPPTSPRPPGASCCTDLSRRETSSADTRKAAIWSGCNSTRTSRLTPPTRLTAPTPRTSRSRLEAVLSTNQLTASASQLEPGAG